MGSCNVLPLLVTVGEGLEAAVGLQVRTLQLISLFFTRMDRGLVAGQVLSTLVVLATFFTPERSLIG